MAKEAPPASESTLSKLTEQLKDQNKKLGSLVKQGEDQIDAALDATRAQREAAREAARAAGDEVGPEIAVKVEMEEKAGLFKKLKLGGLALSFLSTAMTGLSSVFAWLGQAFGPKLLLKLKGLAPWALILTSLTMMIEDGLLGWVKSEEWGTSKASGFLGSFLGGTKSGWSGAFSNAGKWAIMGAGIGFPFAPPVGPIIGGLIGAVLGGILGFIGGEKLAKGFDGIGAWFYKQFMDLVLGPIKAVWDFIAPDWAKSVTDKMEWGDLLPPGLSKLFNGEYFKFDMPDFEWFDLFPKFLVDLFKNVVKVSKKQKWSWMDLLPPFLTKFFTGQYAPGKDEFKWQDLVPEFIWKIAEVASTAWADTPFTWRSLVPNFILKIIDGFSQTGKFSWMDLVPKFISDLVAAGAAEATKTGPFSWKALLPTWMIAAWDSTKGLAGAVGDFDWRSLLPDFIADFFGIGAGPLTLSGGASAVGNFDWRSILPDFISDLFPGDGPLKISAGLAAVGAWDWKSLLPKFIQDFFDDPTKLVKEIGEKGFDWKDLLPQFIRDFFDTEATAKAMAAVKGFDWKSLLPSFIVKIINGEPLLDVAKSFSWKSLLPQWMVNIIDGIGDTKIGKVAKLAGDWWKSLLPDFIVNIMEGKSPFADRDEGADLKKAEEAKNKLAEGVADLGNPLEGLAGMFDLGTLMKPIRDKISTVFTENIPTFVPDAVAHFMRDMMLKIIPGKMAEGGIVGLGPIGTGSMAKSMGLESGGLFTLSQGEFVLDNQAAQTFLQAAMILKGQDLSGPNLANLQKDSIGTMQVSSTPIVISAPQTTNMNSSSAMILPTLPIDPTNGESQLA